MLKIYLNLRTFFNPKNRLFFHVCLIHKMSHINHRMNPFKLISNSFLSKIRSLFLISSTIIYTSSKLNLDPFSCSVSDEPFQLYNSKDVSMRTFHKRVISGWWGRNLKVRRIEKKSLFFHMTSLPSIPIYTKLFPISVNSGKYSSYLLSNQIDIQLYA